MGVENDNKFYIFKLEQRGKRDILLFRNYATLMNFKTSLISHTENE